VTLLPVPVPVQLLLLPPLFLPLLDLPPSMASVAPLLAHRALVLSDPMVSASAVPHPDGADAASITAELAATLSSESVVPSLPSLPPLPSA
jgi:hypothetical protein